jgi:hypothetical protein
MSFFNRLSKGWELAKSSLIVLKENKQLLIFPILSSVSLLLILASFGATAVFGLKIFDDNNGVELSRGIIYLGVFVYYLINYFAVVFFNVALMHCAKMYFNGQKPTINDGIQFSLTKVGAIFSWAVFAATVGTILKAIQEESGTIGKIVTGIIGIFCSANYCL